nr:immunoglobulin light chain junction region [Macaca mulatta]MOY14809.1 immunoglobulin light chain junction region [Macaca mulatta]MOY14861.1 immunoglobulin light chain junction region [Macaca mulatta]MOY15111.1 immunoglobulin light chain junction region [Macaca mulatta]MOY15145.1 immunoglobulin light chain junction region [Macaca mulatta]
DYYCATWDSSLSGELF